MEAATEDLAMAVEISENGQLQEPLQQLIDSFLSSDSRTDAAARADELEIQLRQHCLQRVQAVIAQETGAAQSLQVFWNETLQVVHRIVYLAETDASLNAANNNGGASDDDDSKLAAVATNDASKYKSIVPVTSHLRKLPVILLEDIMDALSIAAAYSFWECTVAVPDGSLLFDDLLWAPTPTQHPCWLSFLKTANKFLRRLQAVETLPIMLVQNGSTTSTTSVSAVVAASEILSLLSTVYPMTEKSATRVWGSHNADHLAVLETELEFDQEQTTKMNMVVDATAVTTAPDYSFYETFWKLQHDFRNPNGIVVADFLHRLKSVLHGLESHPVTETAAATTTDARVANDDSTMHQQHLLLPYLTHSRLLPIQLTDPDLRNVMLTQFWMAAHHLMSQVPPLQAQLQAHLAAAKPLFLEAQRSLVTHVLEHSEPQWRTWKQNKCLPDLEQARSMPLAVETTTNKTRKRKRAGDNNSAVVDEERAYEWMGDDLRTVSQKMRASVPNTKNHLEEYVEALDPDSGIEAEYHPKHNAVFTWRALRLLATEHLQDFGQIQPNGDFEGMVRTIYKTEHGVDIPGEAPTPYEEEEEEDEVLVAVAGPEQVCAPEVREEVETDDKADVEMKDAGVEEAAGVAEAAVEQGCDPAPVNMVVENGEAKNGAKSSKDEITGNGSTVVAAASVRPDDEAMKQQENGDNAPTSPNPGGEASRPAESVVERSRQPVLNDGRTRSNDVSDQSRSRSGNGQQQRGVDGRRDGRDLGHVGGARREPPRDHGRRDDRRSGDSEPPRRDDRRGAGDNEPRRDDRRGGNNEPRRDERRSDRGGDRSDRGRGDGRGERRGGRTNRR